MSYWTAPGCTRMFQKEVTEVFGISPLGKPCNDVYFALHCWRYILSLYKTDGTFEAGQRGSSRGSYMYSMSEIGQITGCERRDVYYSIITARNLIDTDKSVSDMFQKVLNKALSLHKKDEEERVMDKVRCEESR